MLTTKNQVRNGSLRGLVSLTAFLLLFVLAGCTPPGPRALLAGKSSLDKGDYVAALEKLKTATTLLPTNALAWHYYGLAAQHSGQFSDAEKAYIRALNLSRDMAEARFNLGCLMLDLNRLPEAKAHLTAFVLQRGNSVPGLLKLGSAHLHSREIPAAERCYAEALRLDAGNPEAYNGLGLARIQRARPGEAAQFFNAALKDHPEYGPALLNLAVVRHQYLNDKVSALHTYREYLKLKPAPPDAAQVASVVQKLEAELAPPAAPAAVAAASTPPPATSTVAAASPAPATLHPPAATAAKRPPQPASTSSVQPAPPTREVAARPPQPVPPSTATTAASSRSPVPATAQSEAAARPVPKAPAIAPASPARVEKVTVAADPQVKPAQDVPLPAPGVPEQTNIVASAAPPAATVPPRPERRGLLQKLNPMNLFDGSDGPRPATVYPPPPSQAAQTAQAAPLHSTSEAPGPRYRYRRPSRPLPGNRIEAKGAFTLGVKAQAAGQLSEAIRAYRHATQVDPSYFEAHYNLGVALSAQKDLPGALAAYENALAARPNSLDARFNLAWTLKDAGFVQDAIAELDTLLMSYPNEARGHLTLANIYAQQLRDPAKARPHYIRVLELQPRHAQAAAIRNWLTSNPRQ